MDPGHHEEVRNGPENKIHIREVDFQVSEKFGIFPVETEKVLESSGGSHQWATDLGGPTWAVGVQHGLLGHAHQPTKGPCG